MTEHPLANEPRPPPRGEDLPFEDGEPMESVLHRDQMNLLIDTLGENRDGLVDFFVGGNMFVYFSETQAKRNDFRGPDVFVVLGHPQSTPKSWVAWEQDGKLPDIVIELLSPKTEHVDRGIKMQIYRDVWKVRRYYLFDPYTLVFEGYALVDGRYAPIEPNTEGRLECAPLGLELGVQDTDKLEIRRPALRWYRPDGAILPTDGERLAKERARGDEERARADQERARADEEKARADALARRLAELEGSG